MLGQGSGGFGFFGVAFGWLCGFWVVAGLLIGNVDGSG